MKTSELLVEPVLIGFAVLATIAWMASPDLESWLLEADIGKLAAAATAAYFAGIVFDRLADTIVSRLDHHHRLQFALRERKKLDKGSPDPFPEDRLQALRRICIAVLQFVKSENRDDDKIRFREGDGSPRDTTVTGGFRFVEI